MLDIVLVFCPQQAALAMEIKDQLQETGNVQVQVESNVTAGLRRLNMHCDLIVVGEALADDRDEAVANDGGLVFCSKARAKSKAPIVLLAAHVTLEVQMSCVAIPAPAAVPVSDKNAVAAFAAELIRRAPKPEWRLEITVFAGEDGWRYTMRGAGFEYNAKGNLTVNKSAWMCWTGLHYSPDHWYFDFAKVGNSIKTCLCEENRHFELDRQLGILQAQSQAERMGLAAGRINVDTRVTFMVSKTYYRLVLEAIFNPGSPEPWLAHAPMVRRICGNSSERGDLFQTTASTLRALLICADTSGIFYSAEIPGGKVKLDRIERVVTECDRVEKLLSRHDEVTGRVWFDERNVERLGAGGKPLTEQSLTDKLSEGPWDLIHFAGHSYFHAPDNDNDLGSGYLFIGSPGAPQAIKFSFLAGFLRAARFVYLSSCESGNSSFAVEATAAGIHTIMGYRWKVSDWAADLQSRLFYRDLLRYLSVDTAFWNARRRLYRRFRTKQDTWASSMLVSPEH
jgi:hypothetical protein